MRVGTVTIANFAVSILQAKNPKNRCTAWIWILSVLFFWRSFARVWFILDGMRWCETAQTTAISGRIELPVRGLENTHARHGDGKSCPLTSQTHTHRTHTYASHNSNYRTENSWFICELCLARDRFVLYWRVWIIIIVIINGMIRRLDKILSSSLSCRLLLRRDVELDARLMRGKYYAVRLCNLFSCEKCFWVHACVGCVKNSINRARIIQI